MKRCLDNQHKSHQNCAQAVTFIGMKGDLEAGCVSFSMPHSSKGDEIGASKLASTPAGLGITETTVILRYTSRHDRLQYLEGKVSRNLALYKVESYSSTIPKRYRNVVLFRSVMQCLL
jgi:hypothetical protein